MASRFLICFSLFILAYFVTYSSAAIASWQEEFEMEIEAKMNKIETKNIQLEEKVTQLETQLELNVSTFHFLFSFKVN
jgi:cell division protein FtsB